MTASRILALSSSRVGEGGYLEAAAPLIGSFLGSNSSNIAFIPFASVQNDYGEYLEMVHAGLKDLKAEIRLADPKSAREVINAAGAIMVGGGNTFKLLHDLYVLGLLETIRNKVASGTPYIGWSAGANITGPTIATTNDMPIIEPESFKALNLFPFQINPHYLNQKPAGHNGETRDQRLTEFIWMNPTVPVVGLPEGTALLKDANRLTYIGTVPGVLFGANEGAAVAAREEIAGGSDLSWLL